jgi:hypothetical protein
MLVIPLKQVDTMIVLVVTVVLVEAVMFRVNQLSPN